MVIMKPDLSVEIAGIKFKNPVIMASGTFGYGDEVGDLVPLAKLGGIITKTITLRPREGNSPPRIAETASGMLNTIGLQNIGIEKFLIEKMPAIMKLSVPVIISIAGETAEEYVELTKWLNEVQGVVGVELNLSCPNLKKKIICQDEALFEEIIKRVSEISRLPVIAKLSPNVADIGALAKKAELSGADAVSLVNTFPGMAINVNTKKPKLSTITGGLSGPAIKPLALRCVYEAAKAADIPVIGGGGISSAEDAVEFMLAGAKAVSVGTANFKDPLIAVKIVEGIIEYLKARKIVSVNGITGCMVIK